MPAPFEEMSSLDRLVHEPARLALLTALSACQAADFLYLQALTGLTKGNLGAHLAKLEQAGLIAIDKTFRGKIPQTYVRLTPTGRQAIRQHWRRLEQLRKATARWAATHRASTVLTSG